MHGRPLRWRYVVDWGLQGSICAQALLHGLLVLGAIGVGIFLPLLVDLAHADPDGVLDDDAIVMLYLHERFWRVAAFCLVIIALTAIRLSHRVAGPMVRFKRDLRLLAEGRLPPPLRTRRGDFLKQEVACLNAAVEGVGALAADVRRAEAELRRRLELSIASEPGSGERLADVVAACDELSQAVRAFRHVETGDERIPVASPRPAVLQESGSV